MTSANRTTFLYLLSNDIDDNTDAVIAALSGPRADRRTRVEACLRSLTRSIVVDFTTRRASFPDEEERAELVLIDPMVKREGD